MLTWLLPNLTHAINHTLHYQAHDPDRFSELYGKKILWRISNPTLNLVSIIHPNQVEITEVQGEPEGVHLIVDSDIWSLISLARGVRDPHQKISLQGANHLANSLKSYLKHLEIDWEAFASDVIGAPAAHALSKSIQKSSRWARRSKQAVYTSTGSYLRDNLALSPSAEALQNFYDQVNTLAQDVERLERKFQQRYGTSDDN